ncbi:MAG: aldehyde dehydrogenase family protein [Acidobacteriota bacterium]
MPADPAPSPPPPAQDSSSEERFAALDEAARTVADTRQRWASLAIDERISLIDRLIPDFLAVAPRWVAAASAAEGLSPDDGEEWLTGPYLILRNLRLLRDSLEEIAHGGHPEIPGAVTTGAHGQVVAEVFPASLYDRLFYPSVTAEVWMEPGVTAAELPATQAVAYRPDAPQEGAAVLVLGAGNVSSIGPMDAFYKLFVEKKTVLVKAHPVNDYLGPLFEQGCRSLIEEGFLRVVYGGAEEGAYLCQHPDLDEVHITGSDRTYEAIVFGTGAEGERRKAESRPRLDKEITAELGNVSPVIVVPGPWSAGDFEYQALNLAAMLVNNAGFNCNATRVIVQPADWTGRRELLTELRRALERVPTRHAYYPGAAERFDKFIEQHPETETFGLARGGELPWALVPAVNPRDEGDICFRQEAFCGLFAESALETPDDGDGSPAAFLDRAVAFCNETLWGTLNATLIVHPASLKDAATAAAVERAVANLRYGTVAINHWAAVGYGLVVTPWGAFPGHAPTDIQSGVGVVHNTLMFSRSQKTVVRAPFRAQPKPPWFPGHRTDAELAEALTRFEASPSPFRLPGIFWNALRG